MTNNVVRDQILANGIHELSFSASTKEAVDEWVAYQRRIYETASPEMRVRILLVVPTGVLPIKYTFSAMGALNNEFPNHPVTRTATLHNPDALLSMVIPMVNAAISRTRDSMKFFPMNKREEAIHWLMEK